MIYLDIDLTKKENFIKGMLVEILVNEEIKRGYITKIISNSNQNKNIKVQIHTGEIGRLYGVPSKAQIEKEDFKFYNLFFNTNEVYTILNEKELFISYYNNKKCAYLFSNKEIALKSISGTCLASKPYHINRLKRTKTFIDLLKKYKVDVFIIDMKKQLTSEELNNLEIQFKSF